MPNPRTRVYTWEFPVRFTHWMNFLCSRCAQRYRLLYRRSLCHALSTQQYIMGWMRFIHFVSGYVLLMSMIIRIYWMFMGNRYSNWRVFIPVTRQQWRDMLGCGKFYLFMAKKAPYCVGHSALASVSYLAVFLMFLFEIITGFALYRQSHLHGFFITLFGGWLLGIMHVQTIRFWHHFVMYFLFAFTIVHVYIGWYLDSAEKNGAMGSIFGGYKFIHREREW